MAQLIGGTIEIYRKIHPMGGASLAAGLSRYDVGWVINIQTRALIKLNCKVDVLLESLHEMEKKTRSTWPGLEELID